MVDPQSQHFTLCFRQTAEFSKDHCTGHAADGNHFGGWRGEFRRRKFPELQQSFEAEARPLSSLTVTSSVEGQIADDLHHPGLERATQLTEVMSVLPDTCEGLIDDLISEVAVVDQLSSKGIRPPLVSLHQHGQRLIGVGRDEGHQLVVRQVLQFRFLDGH